MHDHDNAISPIQSLTDDEMQAAVGGSWWNDLVSFGVGVISGWNSYQPRERVWSEISYPDCECTSQ